MPNLVTPVLVKLPDGLAGVKIRLLPYRSLKGLVRGSKYPGCGVGGLAEWANWLSRAVLAASARSSRC
jgi:hypothetical protein